MSHHLKAEWGIHAVVFYDKAPLSFQLASKNQKHALFCKLAADVAAPMHPNDAVHRFLLSDVSHSS